MDTVTAIFFLEETIITRYAYRNGSVGLMFCMVKCGLGSWFLRSSCGFKSIMKYPLKIFRITCIRVLKNRQYNTVGAICETKIKMFGRADFAPPLRGQKIPCIFF